MRKPTAPADAPSENAAAPSPEFVDMRRAVVSPLIPRRRSALLLLGALTILPFLLLLYGANQARLATEMAADINRSGALRYQSIYLYSATTGHSGVPDWPDELGRMAATRGELEKKYPRQTAVTRAAWRTFDDELTRQGHVSWATAEQMHHAADRLTDQLTLDAQEHSRIASTLFGGGIACLTLALSWGFLLNRQLQSAEAHNARQTAMIAHASARFQDLFQAIPAACFAYDRNGRITEWNRAAETLFAKPAETVRGKTLWEAISRQDRWDAARELVSQVLGGMSLPELEWIYTRPDETNRDILSTIFPLRDVSGHVTGGISVNIDITERRRAEEEMRRLLERVAASEERLQSVTARAQCLLWEAQVKEAAAPPGYEGPWYNADRRTRLEWDMEVLHEANAYQWMEIAHEEGQSFAEAWAACLTSEEQRRIAEDTIAALQAASPRYTHEFRCRLADNSSRWLLENVEIESVEAGRWRLIGVCTDITEHRATEERLRATAVELERSNAALQEFAYIASHDLKEPLRKIQTFGDLLRRKSAHVLDADNLGYVERMISAAARMQTLVNGLLDYSRVSRKPREVVAVDMDTILRDVLSDLETRLNETQGRIEVASPLPPVLAESLQMRQLMQNLLANALKFHRPQLPPVIRVAGERTAAGRVVLTVADNGIGFDARYAERIFEMFEQLPAESGTIHNGAVGSETGTGVGLAICRKIAERFGGSIIATSTPGEGATFTITLPAAEPG